jgi:hypothetical protein
MSHKASFIASEKNSKLSNVYKHALKFILCWFMMVALNVFALFVVAEEELAFIEGHKILPTTTRDYLQHTHTTTVTTTRTNCDWGCLEMTPLKRFYNLHSIAIMHGNENEDVISRIWWSTITRSPWKCSKFTLERAQRCCRFHIIPHLFILIAISLLLVLAFTLSLSLPHSLNRFFCLLFLKTSEWTSAIKIKSKVK